MFYKEKIDIAFDAMEDNGIDMWIVAGQESAANSEPVLDVMGDAEFIGRTALVFCRDRTSCAVSTCLDDNGYRNAGVFDEVIAYPVSFTQTLAEYIRRKAPGNIALDFSEDSPACDGLTLGMFKLLEESFQMAGFTGEILSALPIVNLVKGVKMPEELEKIRSACRVTEEIFTAAKDVIRPGINCKDIYAFFTSEVEHRHIGYAWPASCNPGVFSGFGCPNGHMGAPDFPVKAGDVVNVDFGVMVDGYSSDMQRMYYLLKPGETDAPEEVKKAFYCVRDSIQKTVDFLKPGVTGFEADTVCRQSILAGGYGSYGFATGHQIGRVAHDGGPLLGPRAPRYNRKELIDTPLRAGFCFTVEPGVETSRGHIQLEENVVICEDHTEFIVPPQKELYLIG